MEKKAEIIISILIIALAISLTYNISSFSSTPTAYAIANTNTVTLCEKQVPYEVQEAYTETEPYTYTYTENVPIKYVIEKENSVDCHGKYSTFGACVDLTIKNTDDTNGVFEVAVYIDKYSKNDELIGREEKTQSQNIKAGDSYKFSFVFDVDVSEKWIYGYDIKTPSKPVERQGIKFEDVEKIRTVTEYRTETGPC